MVRTQHFHCQGPGSIPAWGTKVSKDTILKSLKDEPKKECHESSMVFWFPMDHIGLSSGTLETLCQFWPSFIPLTFVSWGPWRDKGRVGKLEKQESRSRKPDMSLHLQNVFGKCSDGGALLITIWKYLPTPSVPVILPEAGILPSVLLLSLSPAEPQDPPST